MLLKLYIEYDTGLENIQYVYDYIIVWCEF